MVKKCLLALLMGSSLFLPILNAQSIQKADSLAELGSQLSLEAKYKEAAKNLEEALNIYGVHNDSTKWIIYSLDYGEALVDQAKYKEGLEVFNRLALLNHPAADTAFKARLESDIGWTYDRIDQFDKAINHYQNSLALTQAIGDSAQLATVHNNLGNLYRSIGDYTTALEYGKSAVRLYEKYTTPYKIAIGYNNLALTYGHLSLFDKAKELYHKSIELREEVGNPDLLATGYNNLAAFNEKMGNLDQALIYYERSLPYRMEADNPSKTSYTLSNIGKLYKKLGDTENALSYYYDALELNRQYNGPSWTSETLTNLGRLHRNMGDYSKARDYLREALELRKKVDNPYLLAETYLDLSSVVSGSEARHLIETALEIAQRINDTHLLIRSFREKARLYGQAGEPRISLEFHRRAYRLSTELYEYRQIYPLINLADAFRDVGSDSAFYYGEKAISILEEFRTRAGSLSILKAGFFKDFTSFYTDLAAWYIEEEENYERAFNLVEASKARSFADELAMASDKLDSRLPEDVRVSMHEKSQRIEELFSELQDETSVGGNKEALVKELRNAELEYAAYVNQVREDFPWYKEVSYPSPISLRSARELADENTAILEYAFGGDGLQIFLISSADVQVKSVDIADGSSDEEELNRMVEEFRDQIIAHATDSTLNASSRPLVEHLIAPFEHALSEYSNLFIIPDGVLAYLPFEALILQNRYLIEKWNIKYAPSLTSFSLLNRSKSRKKSGSYSMDLLAVAGSNYPGSGGIQNRNRSYAPLPATLAEVDSIASKFNKVTVHKKGGFNEGFIKKQLSNDYRFIHLATHGVINEDHPNLSGLLLSASDPEEQLSNEDGMLRSSEIYQLNIPSEMVVLSACETGLGKLIKGEGILGLQRAFFYAGVSTVTVSLWNVYDRSTAYLMNEFYRGLLTKDRSDNSESLWGSFLRWTGWDRSIPYGNTAKAMRHAKLKMIGHPLYNHPIYWAPFVVVGR